MNHPSAWARFPAKAQSFPGGVVYERNDEKRHNQELYSGLHLSDEESDWVRHYLRVADRVLFGRRPTPRVVVVDEEWETPRRPTIVPRDHAA